MNAKVTLSHSETMGLKSFGITDQDIAELKARQVIDEPSAAFLRIARKIPMPEWLHRASEIPPHAGH